jgi:hypothetical protein
MNNAGSPPWTKSIISHRQPFCQPLRSNKFLVLRSALTSLNALRADKPSVASTVVLDVSTTLRRLFGETLGTKQIRAGILDQR